MTKIIAVLISLLIVWYYFYLGILPHKWMKLISIHFYAWMKFFRDRAIIFRYYLYQKKFLLLRFTYGYFRLTENNSSNSTNVLWYKENIMKKKNIKKIISVYWFYCRCYAATAMTITKKWNIDIFRNQRQLSSFLKLTKYKFNVIIYCFKTSS